jgi:Flp pilus assembly protein TadG
MQGMSRSAAKPEASFEISSGCKWGCRRRCGRNQSGQALVEFALSLTFLMIPLVVGLGTFAIFLANYLTLTDAVNVGARQLAISRNMYPTTNDPCTPASQAVINAYQAGAIESSTPSLQITITLNNGAQSYGPGTTPVVACANTTGMVQGTSATVYVTHQINSIFPAFGNFNISAKTTEIIQ